MSKGSVVANEDKWETEYRLKQTFEFKEGETPDGFKDLEMNEKVTIIIQGTVTGLEQRNNIDRPDLSTFTIRRSSFTIQKSAKVKPMSEAVAKDKEARRI